MKIVVGHHRETPEGRAALERAQEIARERGAELHLVGYVALPKGEHEADEFQRSRANAERELRGTADADGLEEGAYQVHVPLAARRPAHALLGVADEVGADLIVIGMRRRSRVGKLVLGSTAQEVLLDSVCDVLSVKAATAER